MRNCRQLFSVAALAFLLAVLLVTWEVLGRSSSGIAFFFSYPTAILGDLVIGIVRDGLWIDALYTLIPALIGWTIAALVGGSLGFAIIAFPGLAPRFNAIISALGAFPVFAIAPMTLIWFGVGLGAKVFLAFLSSVFIFLQAAYSGGMSVPERIIVHMRVHGFSQIDQFSKVRLPYSMCWLVASLKTGANLALLGVFIGEFITSERGLARVMLNAGGLYDVKRVLAAAICFTLLALLLMGIADFAYTRRLTFLRAISVPHRVRRK